MTYETRCWKVKIKSGSIDRVREWAQTINERRTEALATLRDETVIIESIFLDRTENADYLIAVMRAKSFEKSGESVRNSAHEIDEYHRQFKKDIWGEKTELELLIDLERLSEI